MRYGRALITGLALWTVIAVLTTSFAKPVFTDCYPRATWNGRTFVPFANGEWKCLQ